MQPHPLLPVAMALALAACGSEGEAPDPTESTTAPTGAESFVFPESLAPFGESYPQSGSPCSRLGEAPATSNYLDDSAILVGCPTAAQAAALGGTIVDTVDGVVLVSIPTGDANAGMGTGDGDALVPGTEYNATSMIPCGFDGGAPSLTCDAGVKRKWGEDGTTLVEVTRPDGRKRALFFKGVQAYGADSAQSDGSAGWDFETTRDGDRVTITFGPETYVIVDALIEGG